MYTCYDCKYCFENEGPDNRKAKKAWREEKRKKKEMGEWEYFYNEQMKNTSRNINNTKTSEQDNIIDEGGGWRPLFGRIRIALECLNIL